MDASKDSIEEQAAEQATFEFLRDGWVRGSQWLTPDHAVTITRSRISEISSCLRSFTLPTIAKQVLGPARRRLPVSFGKKFALCVFSIGTEPWLASEVLEYWFVDREGEWYWVTCNEMGGAVSSATVSVEQFVDRQVERSGDGRFPLHVLGDISSSLQETFTAAAERADRVSNKLRAAANVQRQNETDTRSVTPGLHLDV